MKHFLLLLSFLSSWLSTHAQLSLADCEDQFLKKNLYLLAEQYNITAAEANVIQAKLWENPYFSAELNVLNPQDDRIFDVGANGQKVFAIEQLIYLGGKKKNEIELAKVNTQLAQAEFNDLLRQLRYQLRVSYFAVYHDYITVASIEKQLVNLDSLIAAYSVQSIKNNVSYKDVVRLQSLYLNLKRSKSDLLNEIFEEEKNLSILLSDTLRIKPTPTREELKQYQSPISKSIHELITVAQDNRPDLMRSDLAIEASSVNLRLQKSLAVPDLTMGANYDQRGGAFQNQVNLTLGLPLPLINRNQGNIKMADAELKQAGIQKDLMLIYINQEVIQAYNKHKDAYENYQFITKSANKNFDKLYEGVTSNFQKRNITMIEFTDFIESYNETLIQYNRIQKVLINTCEELNYITNANIF